jgi:hypothetical protein
MSLCFVFRVSEILLGAGFMCVDGEVFDDSSRVVSPMPKGRMRKGKGACFFGDVQQRGKHGQSPRLVHRLVERVW